MGEATRRGRLCSFRTVAAMEMKFSHAAAKVPKLNDVKQVKCKLWWHRNSKSARRGLLQGFVIKAARIPSFNIFQTVWTWKWLHWKIKTQSQIHSQIHLDSSTVFYPSANIFIINFGNAIWHLTSNGNLFYCNTTLYSCDFGQKTGAKTSLQGSPSSYVLEFINTYLSFFWVHF